MLQQGSGPPGVRRGTQLGLGGPPGRWRRGWVWEKNNGAFVSSFTLRYLLVGGFSYESHPCVGHRRGCGVIRSLVGRCRIDDLSPEDLCSGNLRTGDLCSGHLRSGDLRAAEPSEGPNVRSEDVLRPGDLRAGDLRAGGL